MQSTLSAEFEFINVCLSGKSSEKLEETLLSPPLCANKHVCEWMGAAGWGM